MKDKNEENATIGAYIRDALKSAKMQQAELAQKIGITPQSLNMMITGASSLPLHRFYQIASILNMPQQEIDKVNKIYRKRLMLTPEQSKQFFISIDKLKEQSSDADSQKSKSNEPFSDDFILNRIITIYAGSAPAERAELLAAAERMAASRGTPQPKTPVIEPENETEDETVLDCPHCKKEITVPEGITTMFCVHCGQKIRLKD